MVYNFYIYPKSQSPKKLLGDCARILKSITSHNLTRVFICNPHQQVSAAFVSNCYTIFIELSRIELLFSFLELKPLMFFRFGHPGIYLIYGKLGHCLIVIA